MKNNKPKYKTGVIVALPLPNGKFAFAKVFKDYDLGVYELVSDRIETVDRIVSNKFAFFLAVTDSAIKNGLWPIIGEEPFLDEETAWAPPRAAGDLPEEESDEGSPMLSHKGSLRPIDLKSLMGLDIYMFCQRPELFIDIVVDRLINGNHEKYRVQP